MGKILVLINKYPEDEMKPGELSFGKEIGFTRLCIDHRIFSGVLRNRQSKPDSPWSEPELKIVEYPVSGSKVRLWLQVAR